MGKLTFHLIKKLTGVDIEQLQEDNNSLNIKTQQLSFDVKDANKEAAYKRTQLSEAQEELTKTQEELTKTQEELTQSQAAVAELQKNISALQEEITRLQSGVTDLQKAKEAECDNLQQSNEQLAELKQQNEALLKEKETAENRVKELEAESKKLSNQLTVLNAELDNANKSQKQQAEEAQKALAEAENKFSELQNAYSESQKSYSQLQNEKAEAEANAHAKLEELKNVFLQLQADKAEAETSVKAQLEELQNEYKQLQADKAEAEANAQKQLRELQSSYQQLQKDSTAQSDENKSLKQQIEEIQKAFAETESKISELQAQKTEAETSVQAQLEETQNAFLQLQKDSIAQNEENQSLKQQAEETQKVLTEVESKLSELQAGKEEAEADRQAVIAQLAELQRENALLKEQLVAQKEAEEEEKLQEETSPTETAEEEKEEEAVAPEKEAEEETTTETEEPEESETEEKEETAAAEEEAEKETEQPEQKEEEIAEQSKQEEPEPQPEKPTEQPKPKEEPAENPTDIVEAYQEMKAKLEEATLKFPYTRITCAPDSRQYIYDSHTLGLKAELFVWGIEGKEMILDEYHFIPYDEIDQIEGLDTIYSTEQITNSVEDDVTTIAETLLAAICASRPVHVTYRDKNGRISEKNLYWLCFQPADKRIIRLPYDNMFDDMFEEKIDPEHIVAMSAHNGEPRIFIISQILSIQVFDCFFSNARGVKTITEAMRTAIRHEQPEAAEVIYNTLPDKLKETPKVVSSLANTYLLQGEYEKAVKFYLSLSPNQTVEGRTGWADYNLREFDELIRRGIEPEAFMQLKEALKEEGWK